MTVSLSKFGSLAREPTPEEKELDRRMTAIRSGRHPDTVAKLHLRDGKTVRPLEVMEVQRYLDAKTYRYGVGYADPVQRAMIELEESRWAEREKLNAIAREQYSQLGLKAQTEWALQPLPFGIDAELMTAFGRRHDFIKPYVEDKLRAQQTVRELFSAVDTDLLIPILKLTDRRQPSRGV